jgi:biotin-dependent carboxylase-like uncharacterized protein
VLEVVEPGLLSTVQDAGRPWAAELGVPRSGACDPLALRVLHALLGGPAQASTFAVVEMSLLGGAFLARDACVVGVAGADFGAHAAAPDGTTRSVPPGTTAALAQGTSLRFAEARDGCRAYLGLPGGIDAPLVLGSRSTCLVGGFGGLDGRSLRAGDRLGAIDRDAGRDLAGRRWPGSAGGAVVTEGQRLVRVVPGPHRDKVPALVLDRLLESVWRVSVRSDRMGIRLEGEPFDAAGSAGLASFPLTWGAIQLLPSGLPVVLLADHQTVGGYPVPLVAASVDRPVLGQLRPGDEVRLQLIDLAEARRLRLETDEAVRRHAARIAS